MKGCVSQIIAKLFFIEFHGEFCLVLATCCHSLYLFLPLPFLPTLKCETALEFPVKIFLDRELLSVHPQNFYLFVCLFIFITLSSLSAPFIICLFSGSLDSMTDYFYLKIYRLLFFCRSSLSGFLICLTAFIFIFNLPKFCPLLYPYLDTTSTFSNIPSCL